MAEKHILLVIFPSQGHINPSLQLAKRLANHGISVTFLTSLYATSRMPQKPFLHPLIDVVSFPTGFDAEFSNDEIPQHMQALEHRGSAAMETALAANSAARVIYTPIVPWAGEVARRAGVPATLFWIQPAIVFAIYFHYYNKSLDPSDEVIELPGLPELRRGDLPSFFHGSSPSFYDFGIPMFMENFKSLDEEKNPTVLMNTFEDLEFEALRGLKRYKLTAIGPLIPSAFLGGDDQSDKSFGGDLFPKSENYLPYLDSLEGESAIYVAFGSYSELPQPQIDAIADALITTGRPFLWVIRSSDEREKLDSRRENLNKQGKIISWCTQIEVLSHPSIGCFVTHCGWNSTLEGLACGVAMAAVPQWTDQETNAKMVADVWRCGVRAAKSEEGKIVESGEVARCLEMVMDGGDESRRMRDAAAKWRSLAVEAMKEDGNSNVNFKVFVDQIAGKVK